MTFQSVHPTLTLVHLSGHITGGPQAVEFSTHLTEHIANGITTVVVDMTGITLINSSGLGMLVGGLTTMRKAGGTMRFAGVPPNVMNLLEMTRLNTVFEIYPTLEEAL
jgi:anti-sigma B factor antagonist